MQIRREVRGQINEHYQIPSVAEAELQGKLLQSIGKEAGDPDEEVVRWITESCTPLGISEPIKPCGIFPLVDPKQASDEIDLWASPWNYTSFTEHRADAEVLLQKERDAGWLEWFPDEATAERKYGQIDYSRIGVVAESKHERLKLRLIHDLRWSGVN